MAFTAANLHLWPMAPGDNMYKYDAGSDTMATVAAAGYFNNTDDDQNFVVDDRIFCDCADGNMWLKVSAIASGSVTTQFAGGNLPVQTYATGTAANLTNLSAGYYEVGTSIATATRAILPTIYSGAEMVVVKTDSGSQGFSFDAGGSGATGVTYDGTNRRIVLQTEGDMFRVQGDANASRWRIYGANINASAVAPAGGSVFLQGT